MLVHISGLFPRMHECLQMCFQYDSQLWRHYLKIAGPEGGGVRVSGSGQRHFLCVYKGKGKDFLPCPVCTMASGAVQACDSGVTHSRA